MVRNKAISEQMRLQSQAQILAAARRPFAERGYFNCKVSDIARQAGMRYHQLLSAILAQGQAEGTLVKVDPNVLAMFYFAFFNGLLLTYAEEWLRLPPEHVRSAVLRLVGFNQEGGPP